MEFHLYYRGKLKGNGGVQDKHEIRRFLHRQLKSLWEQKPLSDYRNMLSGSHLPERQPFLRDVLGHMFVPLVNERVYLVSDIEITMLRPEEPGAIITQSGDIDNRLKTLLDALRIPKNSAELPGGFSPPEDENLFFCLLEDDNLITSLSVKTGRLLEPVESSVEVLLLMQVSVKTTRATIDYFGLGI
jgi:hypothetical protein